MISSNSTRYALIICAVAAMLSSCSSAAQSGFAPSGVTRTPLTDRAAQAQQRSHGHVTYVYTVLPSLGGTAGATPFFINAKNLMAGDADLKGNRTEHATSWINGRITDLGTLGGLNSIARGNPDRGLITGFAQTATVDPLGESWGYLFFCTANGGCRGHNNLVLPFAWQNGVMTALPTLGGNNALVYGGVDSRGRSVGTAENAARDPSCAAPQVFDWEAAVWGPKTGEIHELRPFTGDVIGLATWINESGQVVGGTGRCTFPSYSALHHAVLWDGRKVVDLGNLGGKKNNVAFAINNKDEVVGQSDLPGDKTTHAFYWKGGTMHDLGTLPGDVFSMAEAINDEGQVVGQSCKRGSGSATCRAFLWQRGVMTDLNTLVGPSSSLTLINAEGINDFGQIVGQLYDRSTGDGPGFWAIPTK